MGTRGSIGLILNDKFTGFYNHFDSYPEGLGEEVVAFCKATTESGWKSLKKNLPQLIEIKEGMKPTKADVKKYKEFTDLKVSNQSTDDWYCLLRNLQGIGMIREIMSGKVKHSYLSNDFMNDSLFCEYAYIINLDDMTIEFYKGFQEKPQKGNRFGEKANNGYYPCKMVGKCPLNKIPKNFAKKFYKED